MNIQIVLCCERSCTVQTGEWLFTGVDSTMLIQRATISLNLFLQSGHTNGFSPVWILRCLFKWQLCLNFLSQSVQANGFSPVWILRWRFNSLLCMNFLSQSWHANGFSPVLILLCVFELVLYLNVLSQSGQANGFSPVWILRCLSKLATFVWISCHNQDMRTVFHQCEFYECTFKLPLCVNDLSQSGQVNSLIVLRDILIRWQRQNKATSQCVELL